MITFFIVLATQIAQAQVMGKCIGANATFACLAREVNTAPSIESEAYIHKIRHHEFDKVLKCKDAQIAKDFMEYTLHADGCLGEEASVDLQIFCRENWGCFHKNLTAFNQTARDRIVTKLTFYDEKYNPDAKMLPQYQKCFKGLVNYKEP